MRSSLKNSVVVITGASSGLGRAVALRLAKKGVRLVLAARNEKALAGLVRRCEGLKAKAISVRADVVEETDVKQIVEKALATYGRVDAWVNNAGVLAVGRFEEVPPAVFRKVIETNFYGVVHGTRAILPVFKAQRHGVLLNVSSLESKVAMPYSTAYAASKFAITGFSDSLRSELVHERDIHICTIIPASIDTPLFQHAANYSGKALRPVNPVYSVESAARDIVKCIERPRAEAFVGGMGRWFTLIKRVAPRTTEKRLHKKVLREHFQPMPISRTEGNVFVSDRQFLSASGGWGGRDTRTGKVALGALAVFIFGMIAYRRVSAPRGYNERRDRRTDPIEQEVRQSVVEVA